MATASMTVMFCLVITFLCNILMIHGIIVFMYCMLKGYLLSHDQVALNIQQTC